LTYQKALKKLAQNTEAHAGKIIEIFRPPNLLALRASFFKAF
jgi:hypothetical protein